jgi:hypothetical protein
LPAASSGSGGGGAAGGGAAGGGAAGGGAAGGAAGGRVGGAGGRVGGGGQDAGGTGATGSSGSGAVPGGGGAGEAGSAGTSGGEPCVFPVPVTYPGHCSNNSAGDGESDTDCGGPECAPCSGDQVCVNNSDCLSAQCAATKTCVPLISLTYEPIELAALTPTPKFRLNISYLDTVSRSLRELSIRYYYNHNSLTEPIIGLDSQATIDIGGMNMQTDISKNVLTSVHRFPPGPKDANGLVTDSYLEIAFNDSTTVTKGTKFVITQSLLAASSDQRFDQNSHYSFTRASTPVVSQSITVYRGGQRLWGVEPPIALFPDCAFALGANMNGPALTVSGRSLAAESEAQFTFSGGAAYSNTSAKMLPSTDMATTTLLSTARTLNTADSANWPVPNGKYWAYAWLVSTVGSDNGTLLIGASPADRFFGTLTMGSPAIARWALIGPYPFEVTSGSLTLAVDGSVHLAGVKLYEAER